MSKDDPIWATRDGREMLLSEMYSGHVQNARKVLRDWLKGEQDPEMRKELRSWTRRFGRELSKRQKAWRDKHAR